MWTLSKVKRYIDRNTGHVSRIQSICGRKALVYSLGNTKSHEHDLAFQTIQWFAIDVLYKGFDHSYCVIEGNGFILFSSTEPATDTGKL
jgi:hypothetical protein